MGLTWLGTVPLTSGLVAKVFGTRHLGSLFGVCFLSHQIGSFLGAWLGGLVFDLTGLVFAAMGSDSRRRTHRRDAALPDRRQGRQHAGNSIRAGGGVRVFEREQGA